jgi:uncharacterized protein
LRLLLLREKKPGHFHQVEGVASRIARMVPVEIDRLEVRPRSFAHNALRRRIANDESADPTLWLRRLYGLEPGLFGRPELVIGSGRPTIAAGILLARLTGAKFIFSGEPSGYDTRHIALMLVNSPRLAGHPRCVFSPIPGEIEPDRLRPRRDLRELRHLSGANLSLLLGGPSSSHRYRDAEWVAIRDFVASSSEMLAIRWQVSTSRRTPEPAAALFRAAAERGGVVRFVDFHATGPASPETLYGADAIVVTEDSLNMIAEGLAARRPVIALKPARVRDAPANEVVAAMAAAGGLSVLPIAGLTPERFAAALLALRIPAEDPAAAIDRALAPLLGLA